MSVQKVMGNNELFSVWEINGNFDGETIANYSDAALCFCFKGKIELLINLNPLTVEANDQVIIMPNSIIKIQKVSKDISLFIIGIKESLFREMSVHISLAFFRMLRIRPSIPLTSDSKKIANSLIEFAKVLHDDVDNLYRQQIIRSAMNAFILYTYDRYQRYHYIDDKIFESPRNKIFDKFIDLIHQNCYNQREVSFYADKLCISNKYLTDICHKAVGASAKKIIDSFAILEIKVLLHNAQLSMQDIASRMGFPDQSYMGRYFKRFEEISPSTFRKQIINEMGGKV